MTDEKKIEEQAPEQGEEKVEAVVLDENVLEPVSYTHLRAHET